MPFSMRVVSSAVSFGACFAEEHSVGPSGIIPVCCSGRTERGPVVPSATSSRFASILSRSRLQHKTLLTASPVGESGASSF